jgi:hypothetical protein
MWFFLKGLGRFIPAKAAMWAGLAAIGSGALVWLRRDAVKDDRARNEVAYLSGKIKANEMEVEAENEAEQKSNADLIASNSRGVRDETGES